MSSRERIAVDGSAHDRHVRLEGGRNFRDLGGYATADGRRVRRGRLFRSGAPIALTPSDRSRLEALGLHHVIDFRSREERQREPAVWPLAAGAAVREFDYSLDPNDYLGIMRGNMTVDELDALMCRYYRRMPYDFVTLYTVLFAELLGARGPLAFHCAAGKDRTGIAAALVLSVLGVERETVIEDFLASNHMLDPRNLQRPGHMPEALFARVARVERAWIEASFAQIDEEDGSVAGFVERRLGVDGAGLERLRELYIE